ncbi:unnamed protein product [Peniophora sp. CBMAI 1063]|nr:unnamed protein product [Peniophora sp. CBMAI 1063]
MRGFATLLTALAVVPLAFAQTTPACASNCAPQVAQQAGCGTTSNTTCVCQTSAQTFFNLAGQCLGSLCSTTDLPQAEAFFEALCAGAASTGLPVSFSSTLLVPNPSSTPSTSAASSTAPASSSAASSSAASSSSAAASSSAASSASSVASSAASSASVSATSAAASSTGSATLISPSGSPSASAPAASTTSAAAPARNAVNQGVLFAAFGAIAAWAAA